LQSFRAFMLHKLVCGIRPYLGLFLVFALSACSTIHIKPHAGGISQGRIEPLDLNPVRVAVTFESSDEVYKDSTLFAPTYIVEAKRVGAAYAQLLEQKIAEYGGSIVADTNRGKSLNIKIRDLDYLGPVSLSFYASAWMKVTIRLGSGKRIEFKADYSTPRSISSKESFLQQSFDGLVGAAVIKTLNNRDIRAYLASGP
jgi:hypothetical protein